MNRKTQLAIAMMTTITASSAFAWWGEGDSSHKDHGERYEQRECGKGKHGMRGEHGRKYMKKHMDREFTADEIHTLTSARLIMRGNPNVKVGEVKATDTGYNVTIVTKENSLVKELNLAKNGMPLERFEKISERIQKQEAK